MSDTKENILLKANKIFGVAVAAERSRVYREKRWQMKNTTPDCHIFSFAMYLTYIFCTPEQMKLMTEWVLSFLMSPHLLTPRVYASASEKHTGYATKLLSFTHKWK